MEKTYQYAYILQDIRDGLTFPDRWPEDEDEDTEETQEVVYTRSWEEANDASHERGKKGC